MVTPEEWVKESFEQSLTQIFFVISPQLEQKGHNSEIETSKGPIFYGTNFLKDDERKCLIAQSVGSNFIFQSTTP